LPYSIISLFKFNNIFTTKYNGRFAFLDIFRFIALCWVVINHLGSEGRLDILRREKSGDLFKQNIHEHPIFGPLLGLFLFVQFSNVRIYSDTDSKIRVHYYMYYVRTRI